MLCDFPVINKKGSISVLEKYCKNLRLEIPKSKFLRFREGDCMASGQRVWKRTGWNSPFRSILFWVLVTTISFANKQKMK